MGKRVANQVGSDHQRLGAFATQGRITEKPESGRAIVATFNDGSGASIFWVHDHGLMDQDGHEGQALAANYELWAYLPEGYRTWIEDNLE